MFAKHFYLALLTGETVRNAFVIAEQTVIAEQKSPGGGMRGAGGGDIMERGDGQVRLGASSWSNCAKQRPGVDTNGVAERCTIARQTLTLAVIWQSFPLSRAPSALYVSDFGITTVGI